MMTVRGPSGGGCDDEAGDGDEGQNVVVRRRAVVPGSRGCLWLAPFCFAFDSLQFVIEDFWACHWSW